MLKIRNNVEYSNVELNQIKYFCKIPLEIERYWHRNRRSSIEIVLISNQFFDSLFTIRVKVRTESYIGEKIKMTPIWATSLRIFSYVRNEPREAGETSLCHYVRIICNCLLIDRGFINRSKEEKKNRWYLLFSTSWTICLLSFFFFYEDSFWCWNKTDLTKGSQIFKR